MLQLVKSPANFQDLTGRRFGKLVVLRRLPSRTNSTKNMRWVTRWECVCDCGKKCEKNGHQFRNGKLNCPACSSKKGVALTHGKYYATEYKIFHAAKARAKKAGIPFDLHLEDVKIPEFCPVLGVALQSHRGLGKTGTPFGGNSPTLDRIIPALGYVKGNVRVISWRANHIKTDASLLELKKVVAYLENELKGIDAEKNSVQ